jgi:hypothetical protein
MVFRSLDKPSLRRLKTVLNGWPLNEGHGATARDHSGRGHNGTITNAVFVKDPAHGWVLHFISASSSKCVMQKEAGFPVPPEGDFTLIFLLKCETAGVNHYMVDHSYGSPTYYTFWVDSGNKARMVGNEQSPTNVGVHNVADGTWHLIMVEQDRDGNSQIYTNASADGSAAAMTANPMSSNAAFCLGCTANNGNFSEGFLSNLINFNRLLTADEKTRIFKNYPNVMIEQGKINLTRRFKPSLDKTVTLNKLIND